MAAASATPASPLVHAIGGSLGSALAVFLFYPLERARIELQSQASTTTPSTESHKEQQKVKQQEEGDLLNSVEVEMNLEKSSRSHHQQTTTPSPSLKEEGMGETQSSSSWSPVSKAQNELLVETDSPVSQDNQTKSSNLSPSWTLDGDSPKKSPPSTAVALRDPSSSTPQAKLGLLTCLLQLKDRGALYQGVTPVITTIFMSQFVFFFMQAYIKRLMKQLSFFGGVQVGVFQCTPVLGVILCRGSGQCIRDQPIVGGQYGNHDGRGQDRFTLPGTHYHGTETWNTTHVEWDVGQHSIGIQPRYSILLL